MKQSTSIHRPLKATWWLLPLFSLLLVFFPSVAQAEETLSFYVTPEFPESQVEGSNSYFDLNLAAGATETLALKLQNVSSDPIQVQVTPHTAYTNVHGVVEYGKEAQEPDSSLTYSLDELIDSSGVIELAGNETKTITVPLHMPEESFEGFLAGGLRITEVKEEQEETTSNEEGVAIKNEFAYVVGVVVSNSRDSVQPDLDLLAVFADQLNYRNVISATIQNFTPTFVNRMAIEATVQRVGEDGVLYEASEEMMQMAPNSNFDFPISLEGDRFQSGDYVLHLKATSGEQEWSWTEEFTIKADEARSLNRDDVTIDSSPNWLLIGSSVFIVCLLAVITYLILQNKKNKASLGKKE
ncbi:MULTISPECIES: DUF916 and DUF3324 domain-containing protein [unclassified Enterococcus]|uniref:DUF916 and DUF3324 domain-containing protein n=1 Tax=unclassified Enterococcus TaxID=2608891 RepID=UPI000A32BC74|nr:MULTISPECIES: DUF916 and DUF3324 domain-containing protein [unclassified Enterococcus]OTO77356.1 hypothetical protein A5865_001232 [Enterococcus sp. 12E11_DIV0728]OUZ16473.1 hypothetical protein A5868_001394 [Enterococcus sp. 12F9_DIV0723]